MVIFLSQCGETCVFPARLAWPPDILSHWLPVAHPEAHLGDKSRGLTPHRTPRSSSPSLSSVCALSWSCVFLCSFYVSLSEVPRVSDEHLKHKCNKHLKYRRKQAKLLNQDSDLDGMFTVKAEPLPCLIDKQISTLCCSSIFRNCQKPQCKTCVIQPVSCHSLICQMTSDEDKVRPQHQQAFCNLTPSGKLGDRPGSEPQLCCQLSDLCRIAHPLQYSFPHLQNKDSKNPWGHRTRRDHAHEPHSPQSGT